MDHDQKFCLQSLKDELDNCVDKEVDIDNGKKKTSEEVNRLTKTPITAEKSHIHQEEKVQETKIQKEKRLSNSALPLRKLAILGASNHRQGF